MSTYLSTAEGGTLNFFGAPPAIASCFHATISTPSGCLRRSITQNFCAPTYFTARQSDVAKTFFWRMWQYSNHSPNHGHVTPLSQLQRGHLYISPSLRSDFFFFFLFLRRLSALPGCGFLHPPYRAPTEPCRARIDGVPAAPAATMGPHAALGTTPAEARKRGPLRRTSPPPQPVSRG